ncbi:MAG: hypothetical protein JOY59_04345 [Candidatus Eremiobacteraeota bacterium]|nr:hypothetical protein [Candidatus Eremiobacteraeota bacterium]
MAIYHFCVYGYSDIYRDVADEFAREYGAKIVTILSGKNRPKGFRPRTLLYRRRARRGALEIRDVNSEAFRASIPEGSDGIVTLFDQIFKTETIRAFRTLVNFHPSLLPYYRGRSAMEDCLRNGESATGFTIHEITRRIDDGPILYQEVVPLNGASSLPEADAVVARQAALALRRYLVHLYCGKDFPQTVVEAAAVYRNR